MTVRDNIAKDFHDDLGNKLARRSIFSNLLNDEKSSLNPEDKELLQQIELDANYLYKGTKDFIFSLKSESDNLEELITYLSDFGEDYFKQFQIVFEVEKTIEKPLILPYYWSKQIIFIIKEVMTNTVKHANCNYTKLGFSFENETLTICFMDNGKGFDTKKIQQSNGLKHMKTRAQGIDCKLIIESCNKGTSVKLKGKPHA